MENIFQKMENSDKFIQIYDIKVYFLKLILFNDFINFKKKGFLGR